MRGDPKGIPIPARRLGGVEAHRRNNAGTGFKIQAIPASVPWKVWILETAPFLDSTLPILFSKLWWIETLIPGELTSTSEYYQIMKKTYFYFKNYFLKKL